MIYKNPIYHIDALARYNLHVHSHYSGCANRDMQIDKIIKYADKNNIEMIAITDHHDEGPIILETNKKLREQALKQEARVKVLYGAELNAYGIDKYSDTIEINRQLDYRLYSYNHYHVGWWEHPKDKSLRGYVDHGFDILKNLINSGRADCIAHPFIGRFLNHLDDKTSVTKEMKDKELGDILELGSQNKVAWEINVGAIISDPEFSKRYWNIGKEVGVTFHLGTDAHELIDIDTSQYVSQLKYILEGE